MSKSSVTEFARAFVNFWVDVIRYLGTIRSSLLAAGLAYFSVLTVFPFLLVVIVTGTTVVGSSSRLLEMIRTGLGQLLMPSMVSTIMAVITDAIDKGIFVGGLGLLICIWATSRIFGLAGVALDAVWHFKHNRHPAIGVVRSVGVVIVLLVSGMLAFAATLLYSLALHWGKTHLPVTGLAQSASSFLAPFQGLIPQISGLVISTLAYTLAHRFLPSKPVPWETAFLAGTLSAALAEMAKLLLAYAWTQPSGYNQIYGPVTGIVLLVLWFYYAAYCLLIGAAAFSPYAHPSGQSEGANQ